MAATALEIEKNPKFQELVATRKSLGWTLSIVMLVIYFGFILLVAFDKVWQFLGTPLSAGRRHHDRHSDRPGRHRLGLRPDRHLCRQGQRPL